MNLLALRRADGTDAEAVQFGAHALAGVWQEQDGRSQDHSTLPQEMSAVSKLDRTRTRTRLASTSAHDSSLRRRRVTLSRFAALVSLLVAPRFRRLFSHAATPLSRRAHPARR